MYTYLYYRTHIQTNSSTVSGLQTSANASTVKSVAVQTPQLGSYIITIISMYS